MSTTDDGRRAEKLVADQLKTQGHKILGLNFRTRSCEIDIVSKQEQVVYFTEVKYRSNQLFGTGFEYIGPKKLQQMDYAARVWVAKENWQGDYRLQAAQVDSAGKIQIVDC